MPARSGSGAGPGPRIEGEPAYVLHARPFRETSQLLELLTPGHGRMGVLARASRGGKGGGRAALLQPFTPLIVAWQGRGELPQLVDIEPAGIAPRLSGDALLAGFYANELLVNLLSRGEPQAPLFARYALLLSELGEDLAWPLRRFERELLAAIGFELQLESDTSGQSLRPDTRYRWLGGEVGALRLGVAEQQGLEGRVLLAMAGEDPPPPELLAPMRRLLREELKRHLHGRSLRSWGLMAEIEQLRA